MSREDLPEHLQRAVSQTWSYPLLDAIFNRRSRRFALGTEIPGGVHKYRSQHPPVPLDEIEEAVLVEAATGISGLILADLPFQDDREREVLKLTAEGYTNHEIAEKLVISPKTVDTYRQRIMEKLNLHHRSELVRYALRRGLLTPTE